MTTPLDDDAQMPTNPAISQSKVAPAGKVFMVGLGASAGGLEALERFFDHLPTDTGMAFIVVQHLSADFRSLMDDILSRHTSMPVRVAEDGMVVEPNKVYLNPPKKEITVRDGRFRLSARDPAVAMSYPIDHFFQSLAAEASSRAAAIILSGTGADGSRGIGHVREAGGFVIAQSPATAGFDGMPTAAIGTGKVDLTLAPEQMPDALVAFFEGSLTSGGDDLGIPAKGLGAVIPLLRDACGVDFSEYKLPTLARRTERRMRACGATDIEHYVVRLTSDPGELDALYHDLLIGVTQFFRDREAFERLTTKVIPELLGRLVPNEEFRVWVAGCATGEEAYSLAIIIRECLEAFGLSNPVRIFATDIHREALRIAAAGVYDASSVVGMAPARLQRFFVAHEGAYHIEPSIRSMVVFAPHNVLRDVPFNRLDLVTCRNLLIYLRPSAQRRVVTMFHFGLKMGGSLFLGSSESLADLADEFDVIDEHWKIFRKRRDVHLTQSSLTDSRRLSARSQRGSGLAPIATAQGTDPTLLGTYDAILDSLMPPSLLISARRNLVQTFSGASRYLRLPEGRVTMDAVEMLGGDLRIAVTGALQRVFNEHKPIQYRGLRVESGTLPVIVDLTVREIRNARSGEQYALVTFDEQRPVQKTEVEPSALAIDQLSRDQIAALETELRHAKENLQTTIEELETSNEELQATNEELMASNEELQTTNEELHSVNQELFTVNSEFQKKIGELTQITADMDLLLASTEVHTLFLDQDLRVRRFTPRIAQIFNLLGGDVGRRLDTFNHKLNMPNLYDDVRKVIATGEPFEQQVRDTAQSWFLLRALPYRRGASIEGGVITLIDISSMKRFEQEARSKSEVISNILTNSPHPVFIRDREGRYVVADESFQRLASRDPTGLKPAQVFSADVAAMLERDDARILEEGMTIETEETIPTTAGPRTFLTVKFPMRDVSGGVVGIGGIQTDVTTLKQAEAEAREAASRRDRFLATLSHELRNPLAAVLNASRVIQRGAVSPDELDSWHQIIHDRALHMTRLVDDLLDIARLTQDKLVLKCTPLDLRSTAQGVVDEVSQHFRERGVELVTDFEGELPVFGDATRLQQLQVNLLMNASRYTPPGGRATYSLRRVGNDAEICVADTGQGIAPEMLNAIFDLFVQGERPGSRGHDAGLGVGLALVRRIAELHGGSVTVASPGHGKGSDFRVRIPLVMRTSQPQETQGGPVQEARPRKVVLVDDDPFSRSGMAKLLEFDGVEVTTAERGDVALAMVAGLPPPDIILLDIGLPGMNGYEVCQKLRELPGGDKLLIFALTGFGQESDREAARKAGFDGHLTKPVDIDDVYALYGQRAPRWRSNDA